MTKQLLEIDSICHQCNGYRCRKVYTNAYKNCDRRKMLYVLQEHGGYNILEFDKKLIAELASTIVRDVNAKKYFPSKDLTNRAIHIKEQWSKYYEQTT